MSQVEDGLERQRETKQGEKPAARVQKDPTEDPDSAPIDKVPADAVDRANKKQAGEDVGPEPDTSGKQKNTSMIDDAKDVPKAQADAQLDKTNKERKEKGLEPAAPITDKLAGQNKTDKDKAGPDAADKLKEKQDAEKTIPKAKAKVEDVKDKAKAAVKGEDSGAKKGAASEDKKKAKK